MEVCSEKVIAAENIVFDGFFFERDDFVYENRFNTKPEILNYLGLEIRLKIFKSSPR